jgi:hypothetical protein
MIILRRISSIYFVRAGSGWKGFSCVQWLWGIAALKLQISVSERQNDVIVSVTLLPHN